MNSKLNEVVINKVKKEYGNNIRFLRKRIGISQAELAFRCNTDMSKICKTESGIYDLRPETIMALANALEVEVEEIIPLKLLNDLKSDIWKNI